MEKGSFMPKDGSLDAVGVEHSVPCTQVNRSDFLFQEPSLVC